MFEHRDLAWYYWLVTDALLAVALLDGPFEFAPVLAVSAVQALHYWVREGSVHAFPVQVRVAYLGLLLIGQLHGLEFVHWMQLAATTAMVTHGYCTLARMLSLLPCNRTQPLTLALIFRTFTTPPVHGSILQATSVTVLPEPAQTEGK